MSNRLPLNPPATAQCQEYTTLRYLLGHYYRDLPGQVTEINKIIEQMQAHRATCPLCQARMAEYIKNSEYQQLLADIAELEKPKG